MNFNMHRPESMNFPKLYDNISSASLTRLSNVDTGCAHALCSSMCGVYNSDAKRAECVRSILGKYFEDEMVVISFRMTGDMLCS